MGIMKLTHFQGFATQHSVLFLLGLLTEVTVIKGHSLVQIQTLSFPSVLGMFILILKLLTDIWHIGRVVFLIVHHL